jgi:uncharacterized membrane protein (DUF373 family)
VSDLFSRNARVVSKWAERILSIGIFISIAVFTYHTVLVLVEMDWGYSETFYEMIYRILLIVIGIELIRTLITHDLHTILELLAIVIARKLLKPDLVNLDIILSVAAFSGLLAARKYLLEPESDNNL